MNKTIRVYNKEGQQIEYLSERLGTYPENETEFVKSLPEGLTCLIKEGMTITLDTCPVVDEEITTAHCADVKTLSPAAMVYHEALKKDNKKTKVKDDSQN